MKTIAFALLTWYDQNKRDLPWRSTSNPYCIWVSEIMLQQTRVDTVIPYYERFLAAFPTIQTLATAQEDQLLKLWEGLGYYSRARNLQKAAKKITQDYDGALPHSFSELQRLPGIGPYTAGAIASMAFSIPVPAIDGNVLRVYSRLFEIEGDIASPITKKEIFSLVEKDISSKRPGDFNQALMDLGASLCSVAAPGCHHCPLKDHCCSFASNSQESYPVKLPKAPPKPVNVAVGLFFHHNKVFLIQREEKLLHNLWVFPLIEGSNDEKELFCAFFEESNEVSVTPLGLLEEATHLFTHRIWNMAIYGYNLSSAKPIAKGQWVSLETLDIFPIPTAMKAAKKLAKHLLSCQLS